MGGEYVVLFWLIILFQLTPSNDCHCIVHVPVPPLTVAVRVADPPVHTVVPPEILIAGSSTTVTNTLSAFVYVIASHVVVTVKVNVYAPTVLRLNEGGFCCVDEKVYPPGPDPVQLKVTAFLIAPETFPVSVTNPPEQTVTPPPTFKEMTAFKVPPAAIISAKVKTQPGAPLQAANKAVPIYISLLLLQAPVNPPVVAKSTPLVGNVSRALSTKFMDPPDATVMVGVLKKKFICEGFVPVSTS